MNVIFQPCETDDDFAKVSLFLLERKQDVNPSLTTAAMVESLCQYMTHGHLHYGAAEDGRIAGAIAYYHGTPEREFADVEVAYIDVVVLDESRRGTKMFFRILKYLDGWIRQRHPEAVEARFSALADNRYLCGLYAKLTTTRELRESPHGEIAVFSGKITQIEDTLRKYDRV